MCQRGGFSVVFAGVGSADAGFLKNGHAFGEGGHHSVLDAVVDHFHEMPGAVRPAVQVALFGLGRLAASARCARRLSDSRGDCGEQRLEA